MRKFRIIHFPVDDFLDLHSQQHSPSSNVQSSNTISPKSEDHSSTYSLQPRVINSVDRFVSSSVAASSDDSAQSFSSTKVGGYERNPFIDRQEKVQRFLEKRKKRQWQKKICICTRRLSLIRSHEYVVDLLN